MLNSQLNTCLLIKLTYFTNGVKQLSYFIKKQTNKQTNKQTKFMFRFIPFSPHYIDHVSFLSASVHSLSHSFHLPQSISFILALFGCTLITWSFNLIASFTFQPIQSLEIYDLRVSLDKFLSQIDIHYLKLNSGSFTTTCLLISNKIYSNYRWCSFNFKLPCFHRGIKVS